MSGPFFSCLTVKIRKKKSSHFVGFTPFQQKLEILADLERAGEIKDGGGGGSEANEEAVAVAEGVAEAEAEEVVKAEAALFLGVVALFLYGVVALFLRAADLLLGAALLLNAAALSLGAVAFPPWRGDAPSSAQWRSSSV